MTCVFSLAKLLPVYLNAVNTRLLDLKYYWTLKCKNVEYNSSVEVDAQAVSGRDTDTEFLHKQNLFLLTLCWKFLLLFH